METFGFQLKCFEFQMETFGCQLKCFEFQMETFEFQMDMLTLNEGLGLIWECFKTPSSSGFTS